MLVLCADVAQGQPALDALEARRERLGWEAVGRVEAPGGYCTGTLIAGDTVLTAAHCVYDRLGLPIPAGKMTFRAGYHRGAAVAERGVTHWVVAPGYKDQGDAALSPSMIANDVALLRLDAPVSTTDADPFAIHPLAARDSAVSVVSYGIGRDEVLSRERSCALTARYAEGILEFDCDVTFGSSGAPVFARRDGRLRILSVISAIAGTEDGRKRAFGMLLPTHVAALKSRLDRQTLEARRAIGSRRIGAGERSKTGARFVRP